MPEFSFQYVNATEINAVLVRSLFLMNRFTIKSNNASIHIEIKPVYLNTSYLLFLKYGEMPILNSTYSYFDSFKIFCPSDNFFYFFIYHFRDSKFQYYLGNERLHSTLKMASEKFNKFNT